MFLTNEFDRAWVREISPDTAPVQPILFYEVRKGEYGAMLKAAFLNLFHRDLVAFLDTHLTETFHRYTTVIRPPQSEEENTDFLVIKPTTTTPLSSVMQTAGHPSLSVLQEGPSNLLVSSELREILEKESFSGLRFSEPRLLG